MDRETLEGRSDMGAFVHESLVYHICIKEAPKRAESRVASKGPGQKKKPSTSHIFLSPKKKMEEKRDQGK